MTTKRAPFLHTVDTSFSMMRDMLIALIPVSVMAVVRFGWRAALFIVCGIGSAVLFEYLFQKFTDREITIRDGSAAVTGLLLALSYPSTAPLWIIFFSTFVAIVLIKQLAGGIGRNFLNPAVFTRVLTKILFTPLITNWVMPGPDAVSTVTPLVHIGGGQSLLPPEVPGFYDVFMGHIGGNIGEPVKWAILLGFLYLVIRRVIRFEVPLATLGGLFLVNMLFGRSNLEFALYHVLTGTAMFAAVFMVTDYSTSPLNRRARFYFALGVGILTGVIRHVFQLPGGIGVSILLMNLAVPALEMWIVPRVFGHKDDTAVTETR